MELSWDHSQAFYPAAAILGGQAPVGRECSFCLLIRHIHTNMNTVLWKPARAKAKGARNTKQLPVSRHPRKQRGCRCGGRVQQKQARPMESRPETCYAARVSINCSVIQIHGMDGQNSGGLFNFVGFSTRAS